MGSDVEKPALLEISTQSKQETSAKKMPPRDCFCRLLNVATALCALLCLDITGILQQALRVYGIVFSIVIILVETEFEYFLGGLRLLEGWLARGLFQMFLAVLTLELSRSTKPGQTDFHKSLRLYRVVAGISLLSCSGVYLLGGLFCWGRHKAKVNYRREAERQRVIEDLDALDQKRQELRGLLAVYSNQ